MTAFYRVGTATMYDTSMRNLLKQQSDLVNQTNAVSSGKRINRPSDDPVAAAQAERAMTRIDRINAEQTALNAQTSNITQGEAALGNAVDLVQQIRSAFVGAGGGTLTPADRKTYADQITSLREQLTGIINGKNADGTPLLGALASALQPFALTGGAASYQFNGLPGQSASSGSFIASSLDGFAALMFNAQSDGVYTADATGTANTVNVSAVSVTNSTQIANDPATGQPPSYTISIDGTTDDGNGNFTVSYSVTDSMGNPLTLSTPSPAALSAASPTLDIGFTDTGGASFSLTVDAVTTNTNGQPVLQLTGNTATPPAASNGDAITLTASPSLMKTIDTGIAGITGAPDSIQAGQVINQALANIDAALSKMGAVRSYAGTLLNRSDSLTNTNTDRTNQLKNTRSNAEDLDYVKGSSDLANDQTAYQAALQSYAQVQRISLFNYIS
jgi:flagellar hook-associated protein 3 FlgL